MGMMAGRDRERKGGYGLFDQAGTGRRRAAASAASRRRLLISAVAVLIRTRGDTSQASPAGRASPPPRDSLPPVPRTARSPSAWPD